VLGEPENRKDFPQVNVVPVRVVEDGAELAQLAQAVKDGKFRIPVTMRFPLAQMEDAHRAAEKGAGGKVLITIP
jgi:NADPH:quinone reductase-like Zn-dependent oxidoreductase